MLFPAIHLLAHVITNSMQNGWLRGLILWPHGGLWSPMYDRQVVLCCLPDQEWCEKKTTSNYRGTCWTMRAANMNICALLKARDTDSFKSHVSVHYCIIIAAQRRKKIISWGRGPVLPTSWSKPWGEVGILRSLWRKEDIGVIMRKVLRYLCQEEFSNSCIRTASYVRWLVDGVAAGVR